MRRLRNSAAQPKSYDESIVVGMGSRGEQERYGVVPPSSLELSDGDNGSRACSGGAGTAKHTMEWMVFKKGEQQLTSCGRIIAVDTPAVCRKGIRTAAAKVLRRKYCRGNPRRVKRQALL